MKTQLLCLLLFLNFYYIKSQVVINEDFTGSTIANGWTVTGNVSAFNTSGEIIGTAMNTSENFTLKSPNFSLMTNQVYKLDLDCTNFFIDGTGNVIYPAMDLNVVLKDSNGNSVQSFTLNSNGMAALTISEFFGVNSSLIYFLEVSGNISNFGGHETYEFGNIKIQVVPSNKIRGKVTLDVNSDGCNSSSTYPNNLLIKTTETTNNNVYYSHTNTSGSYVFLLRNSGNYITKVNHLSLTSTPANYSNTFAPNNFQTINNQNFCVINSSGTGDDVGIVLIPISDARPGFNSKYKLVYTNIGSTTVNGNVTLNYDNTKFSSVTATPIGTPATNSLTWSYSNLQPFETRTIDVEFTINTPTQTTNPVNGGDILNFTADITPLTTDVNQQDNTFNLAQTVVNSYDPNDAIILQGDFITQQQATQDLHFRIRFQNTGTASAININVKTMLDADLDWSTFQPLNASHTFNTSVNSTTGEINFSFPNIHLADSTSNEPASHGWLFFRAKPKNTFAVGDLVECKADIFFDYNAPIITNTATTQIGETMSVTNNNFTNDVSVYPNPVRETLTIKFSNNLNLQKVELYNILGKLIKTTKENIIDLQSLKSGIYLLKIHTDKGQVVKKIVKE